MRETQLVCSWSLLTWSLVATVGGSGYALGSHQLHVGHWPANRTVWMLLHHDNQSTFYAATSHPHACGLVQNVQHRVHNCHMHIVHAGDACLVE
ncbi:hypothetical protein PLICRDRAFT_53155 [Plicaturopsis crispa FD-325 SS-3]|nr:hypothetical protein PLICRDRAFT_53155 [Plicaturopsis crispa FD-325 SS-3]